MSTSDDEPSKDKTRHKRRKRADGDDEASSKPKKSKTSSEDEDASLSLAGQIAKIVEEVVQGKGEVYTPLTMHFSGPFGLRSTDLTVSRLFADAAIKSILLELGLAYRVGHLPLWGRARAAVPEFMPNIEHRAAFRLDEKRAAKVEKALKDMIKDCAVCPNCLEIHGALTAAGTCRQCETAKELARFMPKQDKMSLTDFNIDACTVCQEAFTPTAAIAKIGCDHIFHLVCIGRLVAPNCPLCKKHFTHVDYKGQQLHYHGNDEDDCDDE